MKAMQMWSGRDFLNSLDEKYRIVVILYYVQGFKTREIAEILQINQSTVRGRLAKAREKLEQQYNMSGEPPRSMPDVQKKQYTADWKGVSDMKNFDNMIEGLREDTKVPEEVWKRYTATLANLPEKEGKREPGKRNW